MANRSDSFAHNELQKELTLNTVYKENFIKNSLYKSAIEKKIHPNIIVQFAQIYGFQVDFQRDIRKNDSFQKHLRRLRDVGVAKNRFSL